MPFRIHKGLKYSYFLPQGYAHLGTQSTLFQNWMGLSLPYQGLTWHFL